MEQLKIGSEGYNVKVAQKALGIKQDGIFGPKTKRSVMDFQLSASLNPTGVIDNETWTVLMSLSKKDMDIYLDTDLSSSFYSTDFNQIIHKHFMDPKEYLKGTYKNDWLFLHHTSGNSNPFRTIDIWNKDDRGRIGTEFVIGGQDHKNGNAENDGVVVQAFPKGNYAWHLGRTGSGRMNRASVGVELCSMGWLTNDHKTYVNTQATKDQVITLDKAFKDKLYWHKYSDKQIVETEKLLKHIADRDDIDLRIGLQQWIKKYGPSKAFGFQEDAYYGKVKGLLTHTNVRKDKTDCYPDPRLVEMILKL